MTSLQDTLSTQARTTVKQIQDFLDNLPKPVAVVETAFTYSEVLLANAKTVALQAAQALTPETPKAAAKKPATKKTPAAAAASPAAE